MGRYYSGDIEGKFWFGLQSSDAALRFGGEMNEPNYINFYFCREDLDGVQSELSRIEDSLGTKMNVIKEFFEKTPYYSDQQLLEARISRNSLSDYADYCLGKKIEACIISNATCSFEAEL
jgi:hypothetical protein